MTVMKKGKILTKAYRILLLFLLTGSTLAFASAAISAVAPEMPPFTHLNSIYNSKTHPSDVATDNQGRVYVTDSKNNRVVITTQSGRLVKSLSTAGMPWSVAVDAGGRVFVGSMSDGSVTAYTPGFVKIGTLGAGVGEFKLPSDIAVDPAGNIYVVDTNNNTVGVYDPTSLQLLKSIGTPGNLDGQLTLPSSIAINTSVDPAELIVLDHPLVSERASRGVVGAARIQFFTIDGTWGRSYNKYGTDYLAGELYLPFHIAVDSSSRIYVTDKQINKIMVYAEVNSATVPDLQFLGMIDNTKENFRQPFSLTISSNNLLYVVRHFKKEGVFGIDVFGLDQFSTSMVAPSPLTYEATLGGNNPAPKTMTIKNLGNTVLSWSASTSTSWIGLASTPETTLAAAATSSPLEVPVNIDGLAVDTYNGMVDVVAGSTTDQVKVTLKIKPNPLVVTPLKIPLTSSVGASPTVQTITVSNGDEAPLNWKVSADKDWISLNMASGAAPSDVKLFVDVAGLAKGVHDALITFEREGADPCPVTVAVTLTLEADGSEVPPDVNTPAMPQPGAAGVKAGGKIWTVQQVLAGTDLRGVWGMDREKIFAVGDNGAILQFDGKDWSQMKSGTDAPLYSVWGLAEDNVYAVGDAGHILHYDGKTWTSVIAGTELLEDVWADSATDVLAAGSFGAILDADAPGVPVDTGIALRSIWGSSASDVFAVGEGGKVLHLTGAAWEPMQSNTKQLLNSVWGRSGSDVFAVGERGTIIHMDDTGWTPMDSGTTETLLGVWGNSRNDVFAVGANSIVLHYNGSKWTTLMVGSTNNIALNDVWAAKKFLVVAVGDDGTILTAHKSKFPWEVIMRNIMLATQEKEKEKKNKK